MVQHHWESVRCEMATRAVARYVRVSPNRARQVASLIRGRSVEEARGILSQLPNKAARAVAKVLKSAVSNAENNDSKSSEDLYVAAAIVDQAPALRRWHARARGRAEARRKPSSHITVAVDDA